MNKGRFAFLGLPALAAFSGLLPRPAQAQELPGEGPRLAGPTITQDQIAEGRLQFQDIRRHGLTIFSTPFNKHDGYGDGPMDAGDPTTPGGRPTLQGNGTFLRVNGLDGQSCLECHSIVSNATIPATFGVGGVGGSVSNAMFLPTFLDVSDTQGNGMAAFNGRFINPPFLFGAGGVELLAKEMTVDLQRLKEEARTRPGTDVSLDTKGVHFGVIRFEDGRFDFSRLQGIDQDLVVKPFGRKGEFATTRAFDRAALMFHFGMQPVEAVGTDQDEDEDGVVNEITIGELSALAVFTTTLERPRAQQGRPDAAVGAALFQSIGCAECHVPALVTRSRTLTYSFPEVPADPAANVYYTVDLTGAPAHFQPAPQGGLIVPLFADLKRHHMGDALAEAFGSPQDPMFTTARLWGVADTAPYMHDGRALTIGEAVLMHGGEAQAARDAYDALNEDDKASLLGFLQTLRTPRPASRALRSEPLRPSRR